VDLGHAAQRVVVLDAPASAVRFPDRASAQEGPEVPCARHGARMRPGGHDSRIERGIGAARRVERGRSDHVADSRELVRPRERQTSDRHGHLHSVDEGEAFLGGELDGPDPGSPECLRRRALAALRRHPSLAHQGEGEV